MEIFIKLLCSLAHTGKFSSMLELIETEIESNQKTIFLFDVNFAM